ncbi:MAG TPA: DUF4142 domain-containing protein [Chitinophagaceae bacterium]|nr:DUF4142 domain-containing protein [Chitinophagaceae bacterium]
MKRIFLPVIAMLILFSCNNDKSGNSSKTTDTATTINTNGNGSANMNDTGNAGNNGATNTINDADREFVMKASIGNRAEVDAGKLAQQKGKSADVREFGAMMNKDHSDAQARLATIVSTLGMPMADSIDASHKDMKKKLSSLKGDNFDKEYIKAQLADHRDAIALFERQANAGNNTQLRDFASTTLPHLRMHLEKAESIAGKMQ